MNKDSKVTLNTGRQMPIIGLGTWAMHNATDIMPQALTLGYQLIDTSGNYGTQPAIGQGLKASGFDRGAYFLTTKIETDEDAYQATIKDLGELQLSYIDLMLIHWPPHGDIGLDKWQGLIKARQEGLTRDIGVSNYSIEQIQALIDATGQVPAVNQIEWTPFGHSREMLGYCQENGIVIQAYSPLTHGKRLHDHALQAIARRHGKSASQILIRWDLQSGVVPIIKASSAEHLKENLDVFDFELSPAEMDSLSKLNEHYSSVVSRLPYLSR